MSISVAIGVLLFSTASALELTTATWDAETSGKFVKPDWDTSMEQGSSCHRAATSVVPEVVCFRLIVCTS